MWSLVVIFLVALQSDSGYQFSKATSVGLTSMVIDNFDNEELANAAGKKISSRYNGYDIEYFCIQKGLEKPNMQQFNMKNIANLMQPSVPLE